MKINITSTQIEGNLNTTHTHRGALQLYVLRHLHLHENISPPLPPHTLRLSNETSFSYMEAYLEVKLVYFNIHLANKSHLNDSPGH